MILGYGFTAEDVGIGEDKINEVPPLRHLGNCAFMWATGHIVDCVLRYNNKDILEMAGNTV